MVDVVCLGEDAVEQQLLHVGVGAAWISSGVEAEAHHVVGEVIGAVVVAVEVRAHPNKLRAFERHGASARAVYFEWNDAGLAAVAAEVGGPDGHRPHASGQRRVFW